MSLCGKVKAYSIKKGFGLIKQSDGSDDVFVPAKAIQNARRLRVGDVVFFEKEDIYQEALGPRCVQCRVYPWTPRCSDIWRLEEDDEDVIWDVYRIDLYREAARRANLYRFQ